MNSNFCASRRDPVGTVFQNPSTDNSHVSMLRCPATIILKPLLHANSGVRFESVEQSTKVTMIFCEVCSLADHS